MKLFKNAVASPYPGYQTFFFAHIGYSSHMRGAVRLGIFAQDNSNTTRPCNHARKASGTQGMTSQNLQYWHQASTSLMIIILWFWSSCDHNVNLWKVNKGNKTILYTVQLYVTSLRASAPLLILVGCFANTDAAFLKFERRSLAKQILHPINKIKKK